MKIVIAPDSYKGSLSALEAFESKRARGEEGSAGCQDRIGSCSGWW
jgi:hypothetical protein